MCRKYTLYHLLYVELGHATDIWWNVWQGILCPPVQPAFPDVAEKKEIICENYKGLSSKQVLLFTYDKNGRRVDIIK
jgi:hypothetical protein